MKSLYDLLAPAKLNLFLHVVGRREDGLHWLQSPFVLIDWADVLHFEHRSDGALQRHDLGEPLPADDLCLRAARALKDATGCVHGADISITKRVPAAAGMGGGSSDAATTLLALNRLWGLNVPRHRLAHIGLALGADVPFFIHGENAFVEGVGEQLTPLTLPALRFVVIKPAQSLSTRDIFGHPDLVRDTPRVILLGLSDDARQLAGTIQIGQLIQGFGQNDLQVPAEDRCKQVAQAARFLTEAFGNSRMTGSGSAVFARVDSGTISVPWPAEALPPGWVARICSSLARHPLRDWAG
ncbi:MAG: 4-(cytidine 5'-diphospho)-2-C-methyl-D-erythritol kinase [Pseudomonadota bacterium]|nr:4-(cytidine 5'-diphospho)-2-C-methyl-D-erythritol kinase [Pseudomonadota bacterium]